MSTFEFYRLPVNQREIYLGHIRARLERINFGWLLAKASNQEEEAEVLDIEAREVESEIRQLDELFHKN